MAQGPTPTAVVVTGGITVSWTASGLSNGLSATGYDIARYAGGSTNAQPIGAACAGTISTTTCTESAVPAGTWQYTVTPLFGADWLGAASPLSAPVTVVSNTGPPSGGSVTYLNGFETFPSVVVSFAPGTGIAAGINPTSGILQRASAPLSAGVCGSFGAFANLSLDPSSPFNDTSVATATCYRYQYLISDYVGNQATYTSTNVVKVDTSSLGQLVNPTWSISQVSTGASPVTVHYAFTTATGGTLSSVTVTVPSGTSGTPSLASATGIPGSGTVSMSANQITYSFSAIYVNGGTAVSLQISGLTNTSATGSYTAQMATYGTNVGGPSLPLDTGLTEPIAFSSSSMTNVIWTASKSLVGAGATAYSYSFVSASAATLSSVTATLPLGTAGTPSLGALSGLPAGGTVSVSANVLTYTFAPAAVAAGTAVLMQVAGITNTSIAGSYSSYLATYSTSSGSSVPVDTGISSLVSISPSAMSSPIWLVSTTETGVSGVSYSYGFTTGLGATLTSLTMTVPPGTSGTPSIGAVTGVPSGGTISLSSSLMTYSFGATYINPAVAVTLLVNGLTNSATAGTYSAELSTYAGTLGVPVDTGTPSVVSLSLGVMTGPTWAVSKTLTGASAAYGYGFTTDTSAMLSSLSVTVPPGTTGTPVIGAVSGIPAGGTVSFSANLITYSFTPTYLIAGTAISVQLSGMVNPSSPTVSSAEITTEGTMTAGPVLPVDTGLSTVVSFSAGAMTSPTWSVTKMATGQSAVSYGYSFTTASSAMLSSVTMTVPPGTSGSPAVGTVSGLPSTGSISLSKTLLTYTFSPLYLNGGTAVSLQVTGLTNTATPGVYGSELTTIGTNNGSPIQPTDTGLTNSLSLTAGTMVSPIWSVSKTTTGSSAVSYTYTFTAASSATISSLSASIPAGTAGTPAVGAVSGIPSTGTVSLGASSITYSFTPSFVTAGTAVSVQVTGITNTTTPSYYASEFVSSGSSGPVDGGLSPLVSFSPGSMVSPTWTPSSTAVGASAVSYAYSFKTATSANFTSVTMTVPTGTTGTPVVALTSGVPGGGTLTLSGALLTYSFSSSWMNSGTNVALTISGLTNTSTAGSYTAELTTNGGNSGPALPIDTGTTASKPFS
jgi:hypothetical protein